MRQSTPPDQPVPSGRPRKQVPLSPRELREGLVQAGDVGGRFDWIAQSAWDLIDVKEGFDQLRRAVDVASLGTVFLVATALGTLARAWTFPGHLMRTAGSGQTAAIGAVASVLANNLPADVLLGSGPPAHPRRPPRRLGTGGWERIACMRAKLDQPRPPVT